MALTAVLLLALGRQDALSDPKLDALVSVRVDAAPLTKVVSLLDEKSPIRLTAQSAVKSQIVLLDVKEKSWRQTLSRLAEVTDNEWTLVNSVLTLGPSEAARKAAKEQAESRLADEIGKVLDQYKEIAESGYRPQDIASDLISRLRRINDGGQIAETGPQGRTDSINPNGRVLARALLQIDPKVIAALSHDERIVYSTTPTKLQRRLDLSKIVSMFEQDSKAYEEALVLARKTWPEIEATRSLETSTPKSIDRVNLVLARTESMMGFEAITASCTVFSNGGYYTAGNTALWTDSESMALLSAIQPTAVDPKFPAKKESLWHASIFSSIGEATEIDRKDPKLKAVVGHPEQADPLSFLVSDFLVAYAVSKDKSLIAELPDLALLLTFPKETEPFKTFENQTLPYLLEKIDSEQWEILRPKSRHFVRQNSADRAALSKYVLNSAKDSLDSIATFCATRGTAFQMNLIELATMFTLNSGDGFMGMPTFYNVDTTGATLWGRLDVQQRNRLLSGSPISYSALSEEQKGLFRRMVFGARGSGTLNFMSSVDGTDRDRPADTLEPTDLVPNGIPSDARLTVTIKDAPTMFEPSQGEAGWQPYEIHMLAYTLAAKADPKIWPAAPPPPTRLRLGRDRKYVVKLWVTPKDFFGFEFREIALDPSMREYGVDTLPPAILQLVKETMKQINREQSVRDDGDGL